MAHEERLNHNRLGGLPDLYTRYVQWLRFRLNGRYGRQEAEDLAQEAWARMVPYYAANEVRHPRALLLRIAENIAKDRAHREMRYDQGASALRVFGGGEDAAGGGQEETLLLRQLILGLPQPQRDVFVMSRFTGLTNDQIGERLGISPKTVEWRMTKALAHMAAQLQR